MIILFIFTNLKTFFEIYKGTKYDFLPNVNKNNFVPKLISKKKELLFKDYYKIKDFIKNVRFNTSKNQLNNSNYSKFPKISIVIPIYNGEKYIKTALISIQRQSFRDIQIIMVDDFSEDNSVNIIKELMKDDPRIDLYLNEENKGIFYSKTKGVMHAKGKYVMILDEDDMYIQNNAFSTLYKIAEKDKLDILGFSSLVTNFELKKPIFIHYIDSDVLYQPKISNLSIGYTKEGKIKRFGDVLWIYFIKTELFQRSIKLIDEKFLNTKMIWHDDLINFFLLSRNAYNFKHIKKFFHMKIIWNFTKLKTKAKAYEAQNLFCLSNINLIEFILMKTNDSFTDKIIPSHLMKKFLLKNKCRNNSFIKERAINISKLFLKNKYIDPKLKKEISAFCH